MRMTGFKVLLTNAMDIVIIDTELPCSVSKEALPSQEPLSLMFHATYDTGIEYVRNNFGTEPQVINTRL